MDLKQTGTDDIVSLAKVPDARQKVELWSLILQAVHIPHQVFQTSGGWEIQLAEQDYEFARQQIEIFDEENRNWPPPPPPVEAIGSGDLSTFFFMLSLVLFFSVTGPWDSRSQWFAEGAVSAQKILAAGEWWRLLTGLTLHADAAHLLGNVFFGGLLLYFLSTQLGSGTGWLIALASGGVGNALNIWFRHEAHLSVGFSTSVFGMVGAFCGLRWFRRGLVYQEFLLPIGAAAALLAFLGTSGERTDLGAHFWGMVVGLFLGGAANMRPVKRLSDSPIIQAGLVGMCVGCIWLSWFLAFAK